MAYLLIKNPIVFMLGLIAIISILDASPFLVCDGGRPIHKSKLRNELKLSYYTTQQDSLNLPTNTIDAYDFGPPSPPFNLEDNSLLIPSPLSNEPITSPNSSPYGTSWISGPPSPNPYGTSSNSNPTPSPIPSPYGTIWISNQPSPSPSPSPYGTSWISNQPSPSPSPYGPTDPPAHTGPVAVRPQNGPTQEIHSPPPLRPTKGPNHGWVPDYAVWCIAKPTVPEPVLQRAMDYACGTGADCGPVKPNGPCFVPNTLVAHASYAFNSYWQRTKIVGGTCDFGGAAMLVSVDPSYKGCHFSYA